MAEEVVCITMLAMPKVSCFKSDVVIKSSLRIIRIKRLLLLEAIGEFSIVMLEDYITKQLSRYMKYIAAV